MPNFGSTGQRGLREGGVYGILSIPTAGTPVEIKVGASRLAERKVVIVTIQSAGLYWGLTNAVTTSTGQPTNIGQQIEFDTDPDADFQVWLVGATNTLTAVVTEIP